ncbi:MAG: hypothetical protein U1E84_18365 [Rhodoferax sp.]
MKPLIPCIAAFYASVVLASGIAHDPDSPREFWWYWDRPAEQLPAPAPGVGTAAVWSDVKNADIPCRIVPILTIADAKTFLREAVYRTRMN